MRNLFNMTDPKAHGKHRQVVSSFFSEKYVAKMEPAIVAKVQLAARKMREEVDRQGFVDAFKWFYFMVRHYGSRG